MTKHFFPLDGYDHLSEAVPVPGTGCIYMIHAVSGKGRVEECLLELDMDTGRCRIAALPGMGEDLKLRCSPRTGCWYRETGKSSPTTLPSSSTCPPGRCSTSVRGCSAGRNYSTLECHRRHGGHRYSAEPGRAGVPLSYRFLGLPADGEQIP